MATTDFIVTGLKETETECVLSIERQLLVLDAAYEVEKLSDVLRASIAPNDAHDHLIVRALSMRIKELSSVIMSGMSDELETVGDLSERLTHERREHEEVTA
ncbi:MAG: hypothetical protein WAR41_04580 [Azonexus sp.]